jgi:AcrR family transcriptional regulator
VVSEPTADERPQHEPRRADAQRNRQRLLRVAMEAFAEHGVDVQMAAIARRAGLAVGTVYRHFPTKEALVEALLLDRLGLVAEAAQAAQAEPDPWAALEGFIRQVTALQIEHRVLSEFIGGRIPATSELQDRLGATFEVFSTLVARAKRAGQLRADVESNDIRVMVICIARAVTGDWPGPEWVRDRYLGVVLDGLHAPGRVKLPGHPPAATDIDAPPDASARAAFRRGRRPWPA